MLRGGRGLGGWGPYDLALKLELGETAEEMRAAIHYMQEALEVGWGDSSPCEQPPGPFSQPLLFSSTIILTRKAASVLGLALDCFSHFDLLPFLFIVIPLDENP